MSFVAVAVIGSAVVGGYAAKRAGDKASAASAAGAASAADATIESTRMQIEEIRRQFDYQQQVLLPFVQDQQRARQAYSNLLGYSSEQLPPPPRVSSMPAAQGPPSAPAPQQMVNFRGVDIPAEWLPGMRTVGTQPQVDGAHGSLTQSGARVLGRDLTGFPTRGVTIDGATGKPIGAADYLPPSPAAARTPFRDPNVNYLALGRPSAAETELGRFVGANRLSGPSPPEDELVGYVGRTGLARGAKADSAVRRAEDVRLRSSFAGDEASRRAADVRLRSSFAGDEASRRAADVRLAAPGGYTMDPRFQFARGTEIVGDSFTESPGYAFEVEQAMREVERRRSAGGNYGGRALLEAQRRAEGLAAGEYYNWVGARQADLARQDTALAAYQGREEMDVARGDVALERDIARRLAAEQYDIGRGDVALESDIARRLAAEQYDIGRGDVALGDYRRREELDLARSDAAYENYLARRAMDVQRGESAIAENTRLTQYDLARQEQAYYNYLASLGAAAGLDVGAPQAVRSSEIAGSQVAGAYAQQGGQLAGIYGQRGIDEANIRLGQAANVNSALQTGIGNWLTYRGLNPAGSSAPGYTNYFDYQPGVYGGYA